MRRGSGCSRRFASIWRKNTVQGDVLAEEKGHDQSHELGVNTQWLKSWQRFPNLVRIGCFQLKLVTAATSKLASDVLLNRCTECDMTGNENEKSTVFFCLASRRGPVFAPIVV